MTDRDRMFWERWDRWRIDPLRAPLAAYGAAAALLGVAVLARLLLDQVLPERLPFITFFPAVLLAAFFAGTAPALATLVASAVIGAHWLDTAAPSPGIERLLGFGLFLLAGGVPILLLRIIDTAVARIRANEQQLALINRELKHRLKNLFAVTDSIFRQSLKSGAPPEELRRTVSERLQAIAAAQDLMSATAEEGSPVDALVDAVVLPLAPHPSRLVRQGPRATIAADQATTFALMLHELATNATKHGAWRGEAGTVTVTWKFVRNGGDGQRLALEWREQGGGSVAPAARQGFGTLLLQAKGSGSQVAHELRPDGATCRIELAAAGPLPPAGEPLSAPATLSLI